MLDKIIKFVIYLYNIIFGKNMSLGKQMLLDLRANILNTSNNFKCKIGNNQVDCKLNNNDLDYNIDGIEYCSIEDIQSGKRYNVCVEKIFFKIKYNKNCSPITEKITLNKVSQDITFLLCDNLDKEFDVMIFNSDRGNKPTDINNYIKIGSIKNHNINDATKKITTYFKNIK